MLLHSAQAEGLTMLTRERGGILWMRVGEGKTRPALLAANEIRGDKPVILYVTRRIAFIDVQNEIATLQIQILLIEIENLILHPSKLPTVVLMSAGMWNSPVQYSTVCELCDRDLIGCMVLDEGWLYKNPQTIMHKRAAKVGAVVPTILLSGSVMPKKDITDIYGQVAVIGRGSVLGGTFTKFRSLYQMGVKGNFHAWYPKPKAKEQIIEKIQRFCYIHFPNDRDRKIRNEIKKVAPTEQQLDYFQQLKETAGIEGKFDLKNMAAVVIKCQQIANGWLQLPNGEVEIFPSNKVQACVEYIETLLKEESRVVVWCAFRFDIEVLKVALDAHFGNEVAIATLQGGDSFDIDLWKSGCKKVVALATEASGSAFNMFGQVPYGIYFSQDWKWRSLEQSQGRHTRKDSAHEVAHFTFFHTENSMDSRIYYTVRSSQNSEATFIRKLDVAQWLKG